ncbi:zinc-binding dehydrogenase [Bradyrhizobium sp. Leo121]|uniref:zinc-binding dehydrogenase n=1 Tax=Bradyrhizobium sp. Leo121 TaxID=1571195 RepID=UPI0010296080|nr:zinc-binding dehydrogenase [Bradyrhizobium sp. Leo121]RZN35721.1 Zn-dependent oxidoreductase [Bradyrhizobium sp. Leo121]
MKAICVTESRTLEVREVPTPDKPAPGHVLVLMDSATITHGDKFFLSNPLPNGLMSGGRHDVYGSNGGGTVIAIGADVPAAYLNRKVGVYKTLKPSAEAVGMWCETAHVPYQSCLILPDQVRVRDYNGSFANVLTVHAFLAQIRAEGHKGVIVTAGNSATGLIAASLTRRRGIPAVFLVRSTQARDALTKYGIEHVLLTTQDGFTARLGELAAEIGATAVFDGIGGELLGRIMPVLPTNATVYVYGFMDAATPTAFSSVLIMAKNLTLRRFSNLESATVSEPERLAAVSREIKELIDDPLLKTKVGREFRFDEIGEAIAFQNFSGARAVLVP